MDFITYLQERLLRELPEVVKAYPGDLDAEDLSGMETAVRQMVHELGNAVLQAWLEAQDEPYPADTQPCACGEVANYVRKRRGMTLTLHGRVYYRRAYYVCPHCGGGHYPLDARLGITPGQMSAAVVKLAALVGVQDAFGTSSDLLAQTTLLDLSPNSIRKACQQVGEAVMATEAAQLAHSQDLEAQQAHKRAADKPKRLYGSVDGFLAPFADGWHEMKAGVWWTLDAHARVRLRRYYVDTAHAEAFADLVWATGFALHADQAEELIFIADGAAWIWRIVQQHFPRAVQIVDWYHACTYLTAVAHAAFGEETPAALAWREQQQAHLWAGRLGAVARACRALADRAPEAVHRARVYFAHNRTRMRYARFRARGLQIGSGTMESGCKQIGLQRLKIAGARWSEAGACKVAKARAAFLSGDWPQLGAPSFPLPQAA